MRKNKLLKLQTTTMLNAKEFQKKIFQVDFTYDKLTTYAKYIYTYAKYILASAIS